MITKLGMDGTAWLSYLPPKKYLLVIFSKSFYIGRKSIDIKEPYFVYKMIKLQLIMHTGFWDRILYQTVYHVRWKSTREQ